MHRRLFFVNFVFLYSGLVVAESGAWNCEKVKGGEWSCQSQTPTEQPPSTQSIPDSTSNIVLPLPEPVIAKPVAIKPPIAVANRPGWTCTPNDQNESWNCNLVGSDPKGNRKIIESSENSSWFLTSAFDFSQEQIFDTLYSQLKYNPWESCTAPSPGRAQYIPQKDLRDTVPMNVTADYSEVFEKEVTSFFGNVEITRADQDIRADTANYNIVSETMDAQGHVFYSEDELSLYSESTLLNLATDEARLRKALFISPSAPIRGSADVVYRDSKVLSRYKEAAFTSCPPGNQDWVVHAERLKMNKLTGKASAKNAWLEFKGVPFLYTPYISFPLDDRRLSGFLPPTFGSSDDNGFDLVVPYYWNIAPNYDLIVRPRYLSKRGGMLAGEFRYLFEKSRGSLGLEVLPYDSLREEARFSASFINQTIFTPRLKTDIDINYVSDEEYFDELNSALGIATDRHLKSRADLSYNRPGVSFLTRLETYQTIDRDISNDAKPYQKLPQTALNLKHSFEDWPIDLAMENEYVNFIRSSRVSGHRFNLKPSVSFPYKTAGTFITPTLSLQHTEYFLTDQDVGVDSNLSRTLPILSVDSGLFFERDLNLLGSGYLHTLEPRAFYLYIPKQDQSDIPDFDTALYDFSFGSLFRENRFSGSDRIQDANQVSLALTTRLIDSDTGLERLKLSLGEIFYFQDRQVTLTGAPETDNYSNLVAEVSGQLTERLSFSSGLQWHHNASKVTRGQVSLKYRHKPDHIFNIGYRYRKDDPDLRRATIIQTDTSFRWPIVDEWFAVGRWQYSLRFNSTKESFLGVEKESCCWRFRIIYRRFADSVNDNSNNQTDEGVFLQLELKGLANFGDKVDDFLEKNLSGYRRSEDE